MEDFFEIDFLDVETDSSGDAITVRYCINNQITIHVVDGGYQTTGDSVVRHINEHYGVRNFVHRVVATHADGDHAGGLRTVLENCDVGELWMLRPWLYAAELIGRFPSYSSVDRLITRLRAAYPNLVALEEIAEAKGIPIYEPFQGQSIGEFTVLAPTRSRYLDLIVESERTPESVAESQASALTAMGQLIAHAAAKIANYVKAAWGVEVFPVEGVSAENEMSVVQYATLCDKKILLTADAGRNALSEAADFAPYVGLVLPGIDRFQIPHHGSRRNVSTEILDRLLGPRLSSKPAAGNETFTAIVSSAKKDTAHPRRAVIRAMIHRGARVLATEGISTRTSWNAPPRDGWGPVEPMPYPDDQEE